MTVNYHNIITIEAGKRDGKPCIGGLRITVDDYLTQDDIRACFAYAADRERHTRVITG